MRAKLRRKPFPLSARVGLAAAILIGLEACVPNLRVGFGGVSISSRGGVGFGLGSLFSTASQGQHQGQYALPTATSGPRGVAATFHNEVACEDRIGLGLGRGFTAYDPGADAPACYACPEGYQVAAASVAADDPFACKQSGGGLFQSAEALGPPGCSAGTFQIGDSCYSCPADMTPTGSTDPGSACLAAN